MSYFLIQILTYAKTSQENDTILIKDFVICKHIIWKLFNRLLILIKDYFRKANIYFYD